MAFNFSPKIVTDGLVLYLDAANTKSYPRSGTTWSDLSRSQTNGTLVNGPTFNTGNGGSIVFDGANDFVNLGVPSESNFDFTSTVSLECWFFTSNNLQNGTLISRWQTSETTDNSFVLYLGQDLLANRFAFSIYQSNNSAISLQPTTTYLANRWNHLVGVANGSNLYLYLNGIETGLIVSYNGTIKLTNRQLHIGKLRAQDSIYSFNGRIGISKIYNRALTSQEVLQNYNATKSRFGL